MSAAPLGRAGMVLAVATLLAFSSWVRRLSAQYPSGTLPRGASASLPAVGGALRKLPLYFIENRGQSDSRVTYYVAGADLSVYFTSEGVTYAITRRQTEERNRWAVKLDFINANRQVKPAGGQRTTAVVSYFKGSSKDWKTGLPTYASVIYRDLWPGIDLLYSGTGGQLKYTFVVQPGADPGQIRLAYRGATAVELAENGQLKVSTPVGSLEEERPYVYQESDGTHSPIQADYRIDRDSASNEYRLGFQLAVYDKTKTLIIDPVVLTYCGFIGGSGSDAGLDNTVDSAGNHYVTGLTASTEATFPTTVGPDTTYNAGTSDAFVAKVNASGTALVYCGYIGGSGGDFGEGIDVDASGNAYVAGRTFSTEASFPVTVGPDLTYNGGTEDAFVAKVNASGTALDYCGYIGGSATDEAYGIDVDASGNAYVAGWTASTQASFPETVGPDTTYNAGTSDAFVAKVNASGTALVYCGYIGGSGGDFGEGIAVDPFGNAYVAGRTFSTEASFPVTVGPDLTYNGGTEDAFVAKVNASGTALDYCGYIGGSATDEGYGIAVDSSGNAYVTGYTTSTEATFPVTVGPDLTFNGGTSDTFVAKVNSGGTALDYCGYIGGSGLEYAYGIALDSSANAYVAGYTTSSEATFPVVRGPDQTSNGGEDAFVAKLNASGTALTYCGYIGGSGNDRAVGIAVDSFPSAYIGGYTDSTEATFPETVGPDLTFNGGANDTFVAKITDTGLSTNYRSIGTAADYASGTVSATNGSTTVTGLGTAWRAANRGRGDRIRIDGIDYVIDHVVSETQLELTKPFSGVTGSGKAYVISRQFTTVQAWEDCISFAAPCPFFPVTSLSLVGDDRREAGIAYRDSVFTGPLLIDGSTTDPFHDITLTAIPRNRHHGLPGAGVVLDIGGFTEPAVRVNDDHVTIEWLEIRGGSGAGAHGIHFDQQSPTNKLVARNNLIHDMAADGIRFDDFDTIADVYNNIIYQVPSRGIWFNVATAQAGIYNNTVYNCGLDGIATPGPNAPNLIVKNNISDRNGGFEFWFGGGAPNGASRQNLSSDDTAPGPGSLLFQGPAQISYVSEPSLNLHIRDTSVARNAGENLDGIFRFDIDAGVRGEGGAWDIGADEVFATAVELLSLTATGQEASALLEWQTGAEIDNLGFHLYRAEGPEETPQRITATLIPGLGFSAEGARYRYVDRGLSNGRTYFYWLEDIESSNRTERHGPVSATPGAGMAVTEGSSQVATGPQALLTYGEPSNLSLRVLSRGRYHAVLELATGGFYAEPQDDGTVSLHIPGFLEEEGALAIPVKRLSLDALAGREVRITSVEASAVVEFSSLRPSGAELEVAADRRGIVRLVRRRPSSDSNSPAGSYPESWARVVSVGFQGESKKAVVELAPLRWVGASGELRLARLLTVRVAFTGRDLAERSLDGTRGRRHREGASHRERSAVVARLATKEKGLYAVTYADLFGPRRGRPLPQTSLRLSRQGRTLAFHVEPKGLPFASGSVLYFLSGGAELNPYGNEAVYELSVGEAGGTMRVARPFLSGGSITFYQQRIEREENRVYQAAFVKAPDPWLWDSVYAGQKKSYPFVASGIASAAESGHLEVWLQGATDARVAPDHHVRVYVNETWVGEAIWDGRQTQKIEVEISGSLLREGENRLAIENVGDTGAAQSMVYLDRFALAYARQTLAEAGKLEGKFSASGVAEVRGLGAGAIALDLTEESPVWVEIDSGDANPSLFLAVEAGHRYLAVGPEAVLRPELRKPESSRLRGAGNRGDYLAIGPAEFLQVAAPLLTFRESQGLRVKAVSTESVYAEFGFGEARPEAIRDFIAYAYHHWRSPSPRYVVLLGDASYDFKDYLKAATKNRVPPFILRTSYLWAPSDPTFAAVNGEDGIPDLAIGRLPAGTADELQRMVEKILAYETVSGTASAPVVLVADNPDAAGNFTANAEDIARDIPSTLALRRIYLEELGTAATRAAILDAFDEGAFLLSYVGHGGAHVWASENVFNRSQVGSLAVGSQQPLALILNCLNGYFHIPSVNSLSEELMKAPGKGAIAAFSPSGLSLDAAAHLLHKSLVQEVFSDAHPRLGDAILAAQAAYGETGAFPELLRIYNLLGDPALTLKLSK